MTRIIIVTALVFSMGLLQPQTSFAGPLNTHELIVGRPSLSQQAIERLDTPEVVAKLKEFGVSREEMAQRLAALSDNDIQKMLDGQYYEAGGDLVIIALLVIIIILLVKR